MSRLCKYIINKKGDVVSEKFGYRDFTDVTCITPFCNGYSLLKEKDSKVYDDCTSGIDGEFGWKNGKLPGEIIEEKLKFRLEIHSVSPFRYKYVVVCFTRALQGDYKQCPYDFVKNGYSVLYESPDWCTGDSVFEYEFQMNGPKPEEQTYIYVTDPRVIIYPEYPDRLAELTLS